MDSSDLNVFPSAPLVSGFGGHMEGRGKTYRNALKEGVNND
jgi:hypothetical protein